MQYKEKGKGHEQAETKEFIEGAKKVLYKNIAPNLNKRTAKKPIARQCLACLLDRVQAGHTHQGGRAGEGLRSVVGVSSSSFPSPVPVE